MDQYKNKMDQYNINIDDQPLTTISTLGRVANGKSSLIKWLTGINPMKFKKEAEKNMTIKLGYTNCKFYKCNKCPSPYCYQTTSLCQQCGDKTELKLHVSFVDSPGHSDLQTTALSGASTVDFSFLLCASNCIEDPETNEHYKTIKILNLLDKSFIIHNKLDLVTKDQAFEHYEKMKEKYDIKYVIPICAQFGIGVNYLIKLLLEKIPNPINDNFIKKINEPLKASIIRSFDVNKVGCPVDKITGAVVGGTIKTGSIRIGDTIKIIPGIVLSDGTVKPIISKVLSLKTDNTDLEVAYPGGLIGIGLSIDSTLSKEDRLVGNFIVGVDDTANKIFKKAKINYTDYDESSPIPFKVGEMYTLMLGSTKRNIKIVSVENKNNNITFETTINMAGNINDSVVITKNNKILIYGHIINIY
jgi:translation initiation factor 2 subunit 3